MEPFYGICMSLLFWKILTLAVLFFLLIWDHVFRFLHFRKYTLKVKLEKLQPHHRNSNQGPSAYWVYAIIPALWCTSKQQRCKYDISPTQIPCCCPISTILVMSIAIFIETYTWKIQTKRGGTVFGNMHIIVVLKEIDHRSFKIIKWFKTMCLAFYTSENWLCK